MHSARCWSLAQRLERGASVARFRLGRRAPREARPARRCVRRMRHVPIMRIARRKPLGRVGDPQSSFWPMPVCPGRAMPPCCLRRTFASAFCRIVGASSAGHSAGMFTHASRFQSTLRLALGGAVIASALALAVVHPRADAGSGHHRSRRSPRPRPSRATSPSGTSSPAVSKPCNRSPSGRACPDSISTVSFEEGSLVRQGQVLFELDDRPFQAQVASAARRAGAGRGARATAPARSSAAPTGCRPRTPCRSRSASAAPAPPLKRPRSRGRRRGAPRRRARPRVHARWSRRSTAASAARW